MNNKSNIRIVDIAKLADVSAGTVDRVLHNRGRVSKEKREKVEKVLKEIDYKPNMVARFLASKKNYKFAVLIPSFEKGEYWELVYAGIERSVEDLNDFNVSVDYLFFDQNNNKSYLKLVNELNIDEYSGVLTATLFKTHVIKLSSKLDEVGIPYVYIDSNITGQKNLSYFGADSAISGAIAAKLMMTKIGTDGSVLIAHTQQNNKEISTQIENRERGFLDYLKKNKFSGDINYLDIDLDNKVTATKSLDAILSKKSSRIAGIVFNSRIYELVSIIDLSLCKSQKIELIGYDPIDYNIAALKKNKIAFLISQRSIQQGYDGIKALSNKLIFNSNAQKDNYMPIDILIEENIDFFKNYKS